MTVPPAQGPSGWGEDPARCPGEPGGDPLPDETAAPDPDPVPAAEREAWPDRLAEFGEPPEEDGEEDGEFEPLTAEELAEVARGSWRPGCPAPRRRCATG
jgi:hypothetical protein